MNEATHRTRSLMLLKYHWKVNGLGLLEGCRFVCLLARSDDPNRETDLLRYETTTTGGAK